VTPTSPKVAEEGFGQGEEEVGVDIAAKVDGDHDACSTHSGAYTAGSRHTGDDQTRRYGGPESHRRAMPRMGGTDDSGVRVDEERIMEW
jgi:hypothetical protein